MVDGHASRRQRHITVRTPANRYGAAGMHDELPELFLGDKSEDFRHGGRSFRTTCTVLVRAN